MNYDLETFTKLLKEIEAEEELKVRQLKIEFANANNTVKIGDIVCDHIGSVLVDEMGYHSPGWNQLPGCTYSGFELKKDLTPRKDGARRTVYQSNLNK